MRMNKLKTMSAFLLLLSSVGGLGSHTRAAEPTEALTKLSPGGSLSSN